MTKELIAVILALMFVLNMVGCDYSQSTQDASTDTTQTISTNTPQPEETEVSQSVCESENLINEEARETNDIKESADVSSITASEGKDIPSAMELKQVGSLQYYLYMPSNPTSDMPLIIYLHGGTNKKEDVTALLTVDGFPQYLYKGYYGDLRAYVAIPKLDNRHKGWADISDQIRDLIKTLNSEYAIDMDKISLTGHSMGGTGTYQLQVKLSNTFSCIAPMSGSIRNSDATIKALCKTKIWAFVGTEDTIVSPDSSRTIISELEENGADAKITELEGATHFDVPSLVYKNNELIQWLVNCGE